MIQCKTCFSIETMLFLWNSSKTIEMSLLVHLIPGIPWSFTSIPVTFGQGMVDLWCRRSAHSRMTHVNVSQRRWPSLSPKLSLDDQAAYTRDHEGSRVSMGLRQLYTFFRSVMWRFGQEVHWPQAHPKTLRCGVVSKSRPQGQRGQHISLQGSHSSWFFVQLPWQIQTKLLIHM